MSFLKNAILSDVSHYFSFEGFSSARQPSEVEYSQLAFPGTSQAYVRRGSKGRWDTRFTVATFVRALILLTVCGLYIKCFFLDILDTQLFSYKMMHAATCLNQTAMMYNV